MRKQVLTISLVLFLVGRAEVSCSAENTTCSAVGGDAFVQKDHVMTKRLETQDEESTEEIGMARAKPGIDGNLLHVDKRSLPSLGNSGNANSQSIVEAPTRTGIDDLPELRCEQDVSVYIISSMGKPHRFGDQLMGVGGTQAAQCNLEGALARVGIETISGQAHWTEEPKSLFEGKLLYGNHEQALQHLQSRSPDVIVLNRACSAHEAQRARSAFPTSRLVCWVHNYNEDLSGVKPGLIERIVSVSSITRTWSLQQARQYYPQISEDNSVFIYESLRENRTFYDELRANSVRDPFQLICSGKQAISSTYTRMMNRLWKKDKRFKLLIAKASYMESKHEPRALEDERIVSLGNLDHEALMKLMAKSLAAVCPTNFPETFGYVYMLSLTQLGSR